MKNIFKKIVVTILIWEARLVLAKYKPSILAITGSVGKTSTKDATYAVLSRFFFVRKSDKSFNSDIGIPLTILGCPNGWNDPVVWMKNILHGLKLLCTKNKYPEWLVLEVGADKPGDIEDVCKWLHPDITVVTRLGETPVHVEFFKSRAHLIREKGFLVSALKKDGTLILNADDADVLAYGEHSKNRLFTYGFTGDAMLLGSNSQVLYEKTTDDNELPAGMTFRINLNGTSIPVNIVGGFGINHAYAALAALTVAESKGLDMLVAVDALREYDMPPGRMRLLHGISGSLLLDDTYNASPVAMTAAIEKLAELKTVGRKIAVLGDMLELGKHSNDEHKKIGALIAEHPMILVATGIRAKFYAEGAREAGLNPEMIFEFADSRTAGDFVSKFADKGDIILIKGSQSMRMERAVEILLADPVRDQGLLVRQEKEWKDK